MIYYSELTRQQKVNIHTNIKTSNRKELWLKILVDSSYIHTGIDKQLIKKENIKTEPIDRSFEVFNVNGTKNREVIQFMLLELEINGHKEHIDAAVTNLNSMDMFLRYD